MKDYKPEFIKRMAKSEHVGKWGVINVMGLEIDVIIEDYKNSYGHDRFLVSPISGKGEIWVENLKIKEE